MEQLNTAFVGCSSFRKNTHTISKHLILKDGDGGSWEDTDPAATISSCVSPLLLPLIVFITTINLIGEHSS